MINNIVIRKASIQDLSSLYELMIQYIVDFYDQPAPKENELKELIPSFN
jgi:hypothetical protein